MKKRGLCINDAKTETSGDDAVEEWSTPVNWEEDPAIKTERRRSLFVIPTIVKTKCDCASINA